MIGLVAMIVTGIVFNLKLAYISPLIYIFKPKRDIMLVAFSAYCLVIGYYLKLESVYSISYFNICVVISLILILEDCIKDVSFKEVVKSKALYVLSALIISGLLFKAVLVPALTLAALYTFTEDGVSSVVFAVLCITSLIGALIIFKPLLNQLGGAPTQVVFLSAVSLLISLLFWKGKERANFKLY